MLQRRGSCLAWKAGWQTSRQVDTGSPRDMYQLPCDFARDNQHNAVAGTHRCPCPHPKQRHQGLSHPKVTQVV